ncbi:MAG: hypothetical protein CMQ34_01855 [Gammaproteobacteria bacterium]|nr:hypothetical protein [Gammaproteobacteria bacterium]|tara:strand:- start:1300 stop:1704 length:405 start_codon:yes stop_codon:yes gene_type:complete
MLNKLMSASALLALSVGVLAADSPMQATADMSELMTRIIQPASDAVFYVSRTPPGDDAAWREMENMTLMLAESANLLLIPGYTQASEQWLRDTLLMRDAAVAAWEAAQARDLEVLMDLNGALYDSCESCHIATR